MPAATTGQKSAERVPRLSAELHALNERFGQEPVRLGEVIDVMGERAYSLFLVLLALPFFTPVSLLGISTIVGAVIAYLGFRLMLGLRPRLPGKLRERRLPPRFFGRLLRGAERIIRFFERITRRRLTFLATDTWMHRAIGAGIMASALFLMAPLPVPFSNFLPAVAIVALAIGRMEEDGGMVLAGFVALFITAVFFAFLGFFGVEAFEWIRHWLGAHVGTPPVTPTATGTP
ncbi:MAG TPA: exopolysaccharide biosynthesis protein [Opitutaceae bacterium]|nr:exopolysaccharide biosynthesis protein [Opitutaceae bacterium]